MSKTAEKEKYIVAPGCSFVGNKRAYSAGDEIDEKAFGDPADFQKFLSGKNPKIIKAPPKEEAPANKNGGGGNAGETGAGPVDRKQLEDSVIARGLGKPEDLAALSDDELKQLLEGAE
jgi:hypothetical protein